MPKRSSILSIPQQRILSSMAQGNVTANRALERLVYMTLTDGMDTGISIRTWHVFERNGFVEEADVPNRWRISAKGREYVNAVKNRPPSKLIPSQRQRLASVRDANDRGVAYVLEDLAPYAMWLKLKTQGFVTEERTFTITEKGREELNRP